MHSEFGVQNKREKHKENKNDIKDLLVRNHCRSPPMVHGEAELEKSRFKTASGFSFEAGGRGGRII